MKLKLSMKRLWVSDVQSGIPLYEDDDENLYRTNVSPLFVHENIEVRSVIHSERTLLCTDESGYGTMETVRFLLNKNWKACEPLSAKVRA